MKVYKYRGGDNKETFERDLDSIVKNFFWASNFSQLNDPCETLITSDVLKKQANFLLPYIGENAKERFTAVMDAVENVLSFTNKIGIYSLSKSYNDELLWAHYANSHKGFCIEYDLNLLLETYKSNKLYCIPVKYKDAPPSVVIQDLKKTSVSSDPALIVKKMAGYKSVRWKYEEEIRIVIEDYGKHSYEYHAVKSIYFGLKMDINDKIAIMKRLKGRGLNYFQIELIPNTYKFKRVPVKDHFFSDPNYFTEIAIPESIENPCKFQITKKDFCKFKNKATVKIDLERSISETELKWLAEKIKEELFVDARIIGMFYYLKDDKDRNFAWATSHFKNNEIDINIMGNK